MNCFVMTTNAYLGRNFCAPEHQSCHNQSYKNTGSKMASMGEDQLQKTQPNCKEDEKVNKYTTFNRTKPQKEMSPHTQKHTKTSAGT